MSRRSALPLAVVLATFACAQSNVKSNSPSAAPPAPAPAATPTAEAAQGFTYPQTAAVEQIDEYHGTKVADPYRWLEDLDSEQTRGWVEAQNKVTFGYLGKIPAREHLRKRLTELWDYPKFGNPSREGKTWILSKNNGLQNQSVIYWTPDLAKEPEVLLDPNGLSSDGTIALSGGAVSRDGKLFAYGLSQSGSDWQSWRIRDIKTGKDLQDELKWIKFSGASFTKDGKGLFYSRYDEPKAGDAMEQTNYYQKLFFHKIGRPQSEDELVYERKDQKEWGFDGDVTEDGKYLIIRVRLGTDPKTSIFYQDLGKSKRETVELLPGFTAEYEFVGNDGPVFWFMTNLDAPRRRLVAIDTRKPQKENWKELVPQTVETLEQVTVVGDRFIAQYLKDAYSKVEIFDLKGKLERTLELPAIGTARGFGGKRKDKETFYTFTNFVTPGTVYRLDVASGKSQVWKQPDLKFDPAAYEVKQVFYTSKDGTRVPMFIAHKNGLKLDGSNPTYLYGYGGFNIALTPSFSVANLVWMEMGGVFAMPNLRGGGEYGEDWHQAGTRTKKQNVFDDFISAAEWLITNNYTSAQKLAIGGRSNGGLLVGAAMTQRPDLFAAALPGVGVLDMLRFDKFTIGWAWTSDYGSPSNPEEFKALFAYSPYHNLKPGTRYPATLVYTADHDDRVVPAHSFKFISALQKAHAGPNPVLIRIDVKAGHGAGKPTAKLIEEWVDLWGFLVENLKLTPAG